MRTAFISFSAGSRERFPRTVTSSPTSAAPGTKPARWVWPGLARSTCQISPPRVDHERGMRRGKRDFPDDPLQFRLLAFRPAPAVVGRRSGRGKNDETESRKKG